MDDRLVRSGAVRSSPIRGWSRDFGSQRAAPKAVIWRELSSFKVLSAPRPTSGAVFLSYAREDAAAARRIADALPPSPGQLRRTRRAADVEVWFARLRREGRVKGSRDEGRVVT